MKQNFSRNAVISCFLAACLEMYDFTIFGFFTAVLHKNYLSFLDEANALIITYAIFAVGFLFRPLGSIIFGYIGDVYGRKKSLIISVSLMGSASLGMALLPTYAAIGVISCYIIALIRILQGVSVGGEYSGAIIYAVEHFDHNKRGAVGGLVISGCVSGVLLATLVSKIVQMPELPEDSWRIAFLLGFGLSIIGYFIRRNLVETPEFLKLATIKSRIPLIEGIKKHPLECISTVFIAAANGVNFYFILVFLPRYVNQITGLEVSYYPLVTTLILIILAPIFAYWSDKINRLKMIKYGLLAIALFSFLGLQLVEIYPSNISALLFFIIHAIIFSTQTATINILVIEMFPAQYRFSCASFFYSIGLGVIGGTSPLIASMILDNFPNNATFYISCYIGFICILGYISLFRSLKNLSKLNDDKIIGQRGLCVN
jgi:MHS family proline/betaine transporter-like MFS transporter